MELLSVLNFDCKLERFAEVFGDIIETEDINGFLNISPLSSADLEAVETADASAVWDSESPNFKFYALDMATQHKLSELMEADGRNSADLELLRSFFCFVNDAYTWDDLADLERWQEALYDALNSRQKLLYLGLDLEETAESRTELFNKFCYYIRLNYGGAVVSEAVATVKDEIGATEKYHALYWGLEL